MKSLQRLITFILLFEPVQAVCSLRLSELMIRPTTGGEWIELAATGDVLLGSTVSLSDASGRTGSFTTDRTIQAGSFLLVVQDSLRFNSVEAPDSTPVYQPGHWPTLNDDGDSLILTVDSIFCESFTYTAVMVPPPDRSIERIDINQPASSPANWGECSNRRGNTAGLPNSLHPSNPRSTPCLSVDPNPFDPSKGDGRTYFHFTIPSTSARATLDLFTTDGRPLVRLASDLPVGTDSPAIAWDGKGKSGLCPTGRYVAVLRTFDLSGASYTARCSVVLVR